MMHASTMTWFSVCLTVWGSLAAQAESPGRRYGHSLVCLDGTFYLFGGVRVADSTVVCSALSRGERRADRVRDGNLCNDILCFDPGGDWNELPGTSPPPARFGHRAVAHEHRLWIVGGEGETGPLQDTWSWDPATFSWVHHPTQYTVPPARKNHSLMKHNAVFYVYGGTDAEGSNLGDLWSAPWDDLTWTQGGSDAPSAGQSAAVLGDRLYVFGGIRWDENDVRDDLRSYQLPQDTEFHYEYTAGTRPAARAFHQGWSGSMVGVQPFWVIHGGWNTTYTAMDGTYRFTPSRGTWAQLADGPARAWGAACADENSEVAYLYGGIAPDSTVSDELWRYVMATDTWELVSPVGGDTPTAQRPLLAVTPNPFTDYARVEGLSSSAALYDLSGRWLRQVRINLCGRGLPSGIYLLRAPEGPTLRIIKQ